MKIVLDTNVVVVMQSKHSKHYPIYEALQDGRFEICVTTDILAEYAEILGQKYGQAGSEAFFKFLEISPDVNYITKFWFWNLLTVDPDDNKFVDCAFTANANYIVSDDKHFRVLKEIEFPEFHVVSSEVFLEWVKKGLI